MTETKFPLEEVLRIQSKFAKLYGVTGLIAVCSNYVQVNDRVLAELSDPATWKIKSVTSITDGSIYFHASAEIKCMRFMAVLEAAKMAKYGLEAPK